MSGDLKHVVLNAVIGRGGASDVYALGRIPHPCEVGRAHQEINLQVVMPAGIENLACRSKPTTI